MGRDSGGGGKAGGAGRAARFNAAPITQKEYDAVNDYMGNVYWKINEKLYEGRPEDLSEEQRATVKNLDSALFKFPNYDGTVYRALRFSDQQEEEGTGISAFVERFVPGEKIRFPAYTSTSKDTKAFRFENYTRKNDVQMIFHSRKGRDTTGETGGPKYNSFEREVIFQRGSTFRVRSKEQSPTGNFVIHVEDV